MSNKIQAYLVKCVVFGDKKEEHVVVTTDKDDQEQKLSFSRNVFAGTLAQNVGKKVDHREKVKMVGYQTEEVHF